MVNIIVTGHGNFATGLISSLNLIAGKQEGLAGVDFVAENSVEDLEVKLKEAINSLSDDILVLSDLAGGSPFKTAVVLSQLSEDKNIKVISGTNLGMLLETALSKEFLELDDLVSSALKAGKDAVTVFELPKECEDEDENFEDGI